MKLSASVQNVAWQLRSINPSGHADPSSFADDLMEIDRLLSLLESEGPVTKAVVKLRPLKNLDNDLMEFTEKLAETCGRYLAMELMDLGLRRRLSATEKDEPLVLNVHLPADKLNAFLALVGEHDMAAK